MRILALSYFDPASVILSHRNLMRAAGHDFRLAVVRAYTERQRQADYVLEQMVQRETTMAPGVTKKEVFFEKLAPNLDDLREFAASADVIQFHPGIGHGDGDWASYECDSVKSLDVEVFDVLSRLGLQMPKPWKRRAFFFHGSRATWKHQGYYRSEIFPGFRVAASTLDYATVLDAAYLPPLIQIPEVDGAPALARLRGDDDPLIIAHTPTDRVACSTEDFLKAAREVGAVVLLGEGKPHKEIMTLKAQAFAGFDHLRGSFSVNTLENAALGLVPLFALKPDYAERMEDEEGIRHPTGIFMTDADSLRQILRLLERWPKGTREYQQTARSWWQKYFSAEPIAKRLLKFYESL